MKQKFYFVVMVAFFAFIINIPAFGADVISIQGIVYDRATDTQLFVAKARLLNSSDSTLLAETVADGYWDGAVWGEFERRSIFTFNDVDRSKKYIIELTRDDYQTLCVDIDPSTLSKRLEVLKLGKLYMKRQAKTLDEVVVRASKVMFYNKGDTIIYNADAFVLAEGSMLDDLIRQPAYSPTAR